MAIELPAEVTQARQRAQSLLGAAGQMKANEPAVTDVLRQKVQDAYSQNQDIIKPLDEATQAYLQGPQVGREKYQGIFNPFTREKLVSQYRGNLALPMLSLSSILGNRMGRIEDTLGAGVRGYQASANNLLSQAQLAQQAYQDLFNEYTTLEGLRQSQQRLNNEGSGGGGLNIDIPGVDTGGDWEIVDETGSQGLQGQPQAINFQPPLVTDINAAVQSGGLTAPVQAQPRSESNGLAELLQFLFRPYSGFIGI